MPFCGNVIPLNPRCAFNPTPLLPRRLLPVLEGELYRAIAEHLDAQHPIELMLRLCLAYRPTAKTESTVALGWARLLAIDLGWRLYEGTYDYILFSGYFVKLVDRGISIQSSLLTWMREVSGYLGHDWPWLSRSDLHRLAEGPFNGLHQGRLYAAWLLGHSWRHETDASTIVMLHEESQLLDKMENFRNLVIYEQLKRTARRIERHKKQL